MTSSSVSVILCNYNQEAYLEGAIASVLSQTHRDLELIIIDNGSTDGSQVLLKRYEADPRIRLLLHGQNESVNRRINEAIALSSGQFISLLPADDYYLPHKLERQLREFSTLPADYGVVYSPGYRLSVATGEQWIEPCLKQSGDILADILRRFFSEGFIHPIAPLARRECFNRYAFHDDIFFEGESIYLRIALTYKFRYVDEPLTVMREHDSNMGKVIKKNAASTLVLLDRLPYEPGFPPHLAPLLQTFRTTLLVNWSWLGIRMAADPAWTRGLLMAAFRAQPTQLLRLRPLAALLLSMFPVSAILTFNRAMNALRNHKETIAFKAEY